MRPDASGRRPGRRARSAEAVGGNRRARRAAGAARRARVRRGACSGRRRRSSRSRPSPRRPTGRTEASSTAHPTAPWPTVSRSARIKPLFDVVAERDAGNEDVMNSAKTAMPASSMATTATSAEPCTSVQIAERRRSPRPRSARSHSDAAAQGPGSGGPQARGRGRARSAAGPDRATPRARARPAPCRSSLRAASRALPSASAPGGSLEPTHAFFGHEIADQVGLPGDVARPDPRPGRPCAGTRGSRTGRRTPRRRSRDERPCARSELGGSSRIPVLRRLAAARAGSLRCRPRPRATGGATQTRSATSPGGDRSFGSSPHSGPRLPFARPA